ncbi:predicted protein [Verticillium alfalfae VaMs.102]|uniref:Predicted protein n=1 Tax=Verticillium alfalfae (strain VaMs.102 / ATCC MYA-4576 / FGSC 10136) TaxID=526221 RepID=C9S5B4_VERA1|nr:predicted protein [Verticillium alfalfae VaMs.102]EEY15022.1 predicted protein [Verticillium alfalfae VaMs.102]
MSDLAVIDRKNRALYEKDTELLRLTKRLKKEGHEATVSDLLLNDVATELAHQHQKLKFAVYHANLFQDRQKLLLSLLEESLRHGQEPIQAVINNWKPICIGTDRISDLSSDGAAVAQLLRIVDARNEELDNTVGRI